MYIPVLTTQLVISGYGKKKNDILIVKIRQPPLPPLFKMSANGDLTITCNHLEIESSISRT